MMAKTMALGGWLLIAAGVATSPQAPFSAANSVCFAIYVMLILSAGVFEWLLRIRN